MTAERFDAIIVGAGQAGPAMAARCSKEGLRTAIIERAHFGGTCVNVGCIPKRSQCRVPPLVAVRATRARFGLGVIVCREEAEADGHGVVTLKVGEPAGGFASDVVKADTYAEPTKLR